MLSEVAQKALPDRVRRRLRRAYSRAQRLVTSLRFDTEQLSPQPSGFDFPVARENPLTEIAAAYEPTKRFHHYLPHYWCHFRDVREAVRNVIEIGVETDRSVRTWEEFFPNAIIHGVDIDPDCRSCEGGRRRIHIGDQSDVSFLCSLLGEIGAPDIVIDDGSHRVEHQLTTFGYLFPRMTDHGIYAIEDVGGCANDTALATPSALKSLVDAINYWPADREGADWIRVDRFDERAKWVDRNTIGVAFYRHIIFAMRGHNPSDNPYLYA